MRRNARWLQAAGLTAVFSLAACGSSTGPDEQQAEQDIGGQREGEPDAPADVQDARDDAAQGSDAADVREEDSPVVGDVGRDTADDPTEGDTEAGLDGASDDAGEHEDALDAREEPDSSDPSDAGDGAVDVVNEPDATDVADGTDAADQADTADMADHADAADLSDASDAATDLADMADLTDMTDASTDLADTADLSDATDTADQTDTGDLRDTADGGGEPPTELTEDEMNRCESLIAAHFAGGDADLFIGAYREDRGAWDPTSGLVVAAVPTEDGAYFGAMSNTYLDCFRELGAGGRYSGVRTGDTATGEYAIRQAAGTFNGSYDATFSEGGTIFGGEYDVTGGRRQGEGGVMQNNCMLSGVIDNPGGTPPITSRSRTPYGVEYFVGECIGYCANHGEFRMFHADDGNSGSTANVPFSVTQPVDGGTVLLTSLDNPNTDGADESSTALNYAIIDLSQACTNELPLLASCPGRLIGSPVLDATHSEACEVDLPFPASPPAGCGCFFLGDYQPGGRYAVIGINEDPPADILGAASLGTAINDFDALYVRTFEYSE